MISAFFIQNNINCRNATVIYRIAKCCKIEYWLEDSIIGLARRCLIVVFEEVLNGATDKNFKVSENELDDVINDLYKRTLGMAELANAWKQVATREVAMEDGVKTIGAFDEENRNVEVVVVEDTVVCSRYSYT